MTQGRIEELVGQLGDDSYRVRERAAEELLKCGIQTKAALFSGTKSGEPEIALRCRRLWCEVRMDVGWRHVRELIGDGRVAAKQRQYCLVALAKQNCPEDAELIAHALSDWSVLDVWVTKGVAVKSQLRDVALAAQIHRGGQDPRDFDFKYLRQDDRRLFSPASLGFKDDAERRGAFDKWSDWLARNAGWPLTP